MISDLQNAFCAWDDQKGFGVMKYSDVKGKFVDKRLKGLPGQGLLHIRADLDFMNRHKHQMNDFWRNG